MEFTQEQEIETLKKVLKIETNLFEERLAKAQVDWFIYGMVIAIAVMAIGIIFMEVIG